MKRFLLVFACIILAASLYARIIPVTFDTATGTFYTNGVVWVPGTGSGGSSGTNTWLATMAPLALNTAQTNTYTNGIIVEATVGLQTLLSTDVAKVVAMVETNSGSGAFVIKDIAMFGGIAASNQNTLVYTVPPACRHYLTNLSAGTSIATVITNWIDQLITAGPIGATGATGATGPPDTLGSNVVSARIGTTFETNSYPFLAFFGDSTMAFGGTPGEVYGVPYHLMTNYSIGSQGIYNLAYPSTTLSNMVANYGGSDPVNNYRIDRGYITNQGIAVIMLGLNDISQNRTFAQITNDFGTAYGLLRADGLKIMSISALFNTNWTTGTSGQRSVWTNLIAWQVASTLPDWFTNVGIVATDDGVHPSSAGALTIANAIAPLLAPSIKKRSLIGFRAQEAVFDTSELSPRGVNALPAIRSMGPILLYNGSGIEFFSGGTQGNRIRADDDGTFNMVFDIIGVPLMRLTQSGFWVNTNVYVLSITATNNVVFTPGAASVDSTTTNVTVLSINGPNVLWVNARSNVNITAIMEGNSALVARGTLIFTNRTGTDRILGLSAVSNNWTCLQQFDGITAPHTLTNGLAARLDYEIIGTNVQYSFKPVALPK